MCPTGFGIGRCASGAPRSGCNGRSPPGAPPPCSPSGSCSTTPSARAFTLGGIVGRRAEPAVGRAASAHRMTAHPRARLDDLVHQPVRFSLLAGLAQADELEFQFLRDTLQVSDSLLSRQASTLETGWLHRHPQRPCGQVRTHLAQAHPRRPHRLHQPPRDPARDRRGPRPARQPDSRLTRDHGPRTRAANQDCPGARGHRDTPREFCWAWVRLLTWSLPDQRNWLCSRFAVARQ